jgi:hypothetical protein
MSGEETEIAIAGPMVVEIDANDIAKIIADCGSPEALAIKAANLIIDYLITVHRNATRQQ